MAFLDDLFLAFTNDYVSLPHSLSERDIQHLDYCGSSYREFILRECDRLGIVYKEEGK